MREQRAEMTVTPPLACRFYVTYVGVSLALTLIEPLSEADVKNRNIFFRAYFDGQDHLLACEKVVNGTIHLSHKYEYHKNGKIKLATITIPEEDEEALIIHFDDNGNRI